MHRKLKPHQCEDCDASFAQITSLKVHIRSVHKKMRPYACPSSGCKFASAEKGPLSVHFERVHKRAKYHKCPECDYEAYALNVVNQHINAGDFMITTINWLETITNKESKSSLLYANIYIPYYIPFSLTIRQKLRRILETLQYPFSYITLLYIFFYY